MKTYEFTYVICGQGESEEEALDAALENFLQDFGSPVDSRLVEDDEDDENRPQQ